VKTLEKKLYCGIIELLRGISSMEVKKRSKKNKKKVNKIEKTNKNDLLLEKGVKEQTVVDEIKDEVISEVLRDVIVEVKSESDGSVISELKEEQVLEEENDIKEDIGETYNTNNSKKKYKGLLIILLILTVLSLIVVLCFPRIELSGSDEISISYNDRYIEPGYNGYILNKDISSDINVVSNINDGVIGEYEVEYRYNLYGIKFKKVRKVRIIDDVNPIINVEKETIQVCPNAEIPDIEYNAIDEYDGDITTRVEKIVNDNEILFKVDDLSHNSTSLVVNVERKDDKNPEIKLKGSSVMYLTYGNTFKEPGYTANDNCSGELTDKVVVSGSVGRNIGTYLLKYEVVDESGNQESVTRKVIIGTKIKDNGSINKGTIYLTFDDGPNQGTTNKILDILKYEGVKATFFVTCNGPDDLIKRMYDEGHTVALHTASHNYSYVYSSVDNYFADLNKVSARVKRITGIDSKIIRFPGGSSNTISKNYNRGIMTELTNIVLNDGYRYFDWNVDGMDASTARSSDDVYYNVTANLSTSSANVVLLHDTKSITAGALKDIIKFGKEYGYKFSAIDMNTYMVRHKVNN